MAKKSINVVSLRGIIADKGNKSLSLNNIQALIDKAFCKKTIAVGLLINSPGGSAAQSEIIAKYIKNKSEETKIPVFAFVADMAASGGYFIACAANEIYALATTSIVGSIGVLYSGFGLVDFINKHGIERRLYTAGKDKALLDMFQEKNDTGVEFIKELLQETHELFKGFVKKHRGNRLKGAEEELFSGKFWLSQTAVKKGLIDGIVPTCECFFKGKFGKKVKINYIKQKKSFLANLLSSKSQLQNIINEDLRYLLSELSTKGIEFRKY